MSWQSGLPVGGWSVLRDDPAAEAALAAELVAEDGLGFYVADAEREYERTNDGVRDAEPDLGGAALLAEAGTIGFSVYPAEASEIAWDAYGAAIAADGIARPPP